MKTTERRIYSYDFEVTAMAKQAQPPPMLDILRAIEHRAEAGTKVHMSSKKTRATTLGELQIDEAAGLARLLIRFGDKNLPDAVYSDPAEGKFRRLEKSPGEFGEVGAHLVISLKPHKELPHHYLTLFEGVRSLTMYNVRALLNHLLREEYAAKPDRFTYGDAAGGKQRNQFLPLLEFNGLLSDDFIEELESGKLRSVALIHNEKRTPLGSAPFLEKQARELKLAVTDRTAKDMWKKMKAAFKAESGVYQTARVSFEKSDKGSGTVYITTATGQPAQIKYLRSILIEDINPGLAESTQKIVPHFMASIEKELLAQIKRD